MACNYPFEKLKKIHEILSGKDYGILLISSHPTIYLFIEQLPNASLSISRALENIKRFKGDIEL
jgi:hypothetical protein